MTHKPISRPADQAKMNAAFACQALQVVQDPQRCSNNPILRRIAWMTLMGVRGKRCDQTRLAQMQAGGCK